MNKKLLQGLLMMALFLPFLGNTWAAKAQTDTVVRIAPQTIRLKPGQRATIEVWIDTSENLRAFDVKIDFDVNAISADSLTLGNFFISGLPSPFNGVDNDLGTIYYGIAIVGDEAIQTGSGILFKFDIIAHKDISTTELEITMADLVKEDYFLASCTTENATVIVSNDPEMNKLIFLPLVVH